MKKVLFLADIDGLLISGNMPEVKDRRYIIASKTRNGKKGIAQSSLTELKKLAEVADIVPVTRMDMKSYNSVALCVPCPMALVENGATLLYGGREDPGWRYNSLDIIFNDRDNLYEAGKMLSKKGYDKNGDGSFVLDYIAPKGTNIHADVEEVRKIIGNEYRIRKYDNERLYAYHEKLGRTKMVEKLLRKKLGTYDMIIAAAKDSGWIPEGVFSISLEGEKTNLTYPLNDYNRDPHLFAEWVFQSSLEEIKKNFY